LAAEICDGWIPLYYSPYRPEVYAESLRASRPGFEIFYPIRLQITDDTAKGLAELKPGLAFYVGGMGAKQRNFHRELMARMGYEEASLRIQDLFLAGRREEAIAAVPDAFVDEISLVGPPARIRDRLAAWRASPVTTLLVGARTTDELRRMAELVLA
jgi:alkanesulfonate monooxygenase SsuD/methylene tetrahydromethanopterin reductase-like flavin-dependent oxidoreductase (luciferase family)